jgi:hydroxymethylpyrimidine/phosphomethylpyrimidine kinase
MQTLLTIAGFDPSNGAGVTADLAVFAAHGFFGTSAITALTVQSTLGVRATHPVKADVLGATLDCLADDLPPAGIKIGMLATEANVVCVCAFLEGLRASGAKFPVVLDPVLRSSSGRELLSPAGLGVLRERLLPLVDWVTPNLDELGILACLPVGGPAEMELAAASLRERLSGLGVVATGGHLEVPNDLVVAAGSASWVRGERVAGSSTHGTGCAFSSALLCNLVEGMDAREATAKAKDYVARAILYAPGVGRGNGPMNLLWNLRSDRSEPV